MGTKYEIQPAFSSSLVRRRPM